MVVISNPRSPTLRTYTTNPTHSSPSTS